MLVVQKGLWELRGFAVLALSSSCEHVSLSFDREQLSKIGRQRSRCSHLVNLGALERVE